MFTNVIKIFEPVSCENLKLQDLRMRPREDSAFTLLQAPIGCCEKQALGFY